MFNPTEYLEQIATGAEKAVAANRSAAAEILMAAEAIETYAKNCRQKARQMRDTAKEL